MSKFESCTKLVYAAVAAFNLSVTACGGATSPEIRGGKPTFCPAVSLSLAADTLASPNFRGGDGEVDSVTK